jgi:hypothetical protein
MTDRVILLTICILIGIPWYLGQAHWIYAHAPKITVLMLAMAVLVWVGFRLEDLGSRCKRAVGRGCVRARAKLKGQDAAKLQRELFRHELHWQDREYIRYLISGRDRSAEKARQQVEALKQEERTRDEKDREQLKELRRQNDEAMRKWKENHKE